MIIIISSKQEFVSSLLEYDLHQGRDLVSAVFSEPTIGFHIYVLNEFMHLKGMVSARLLCPWRFSRQEYWNVLELSYRCYSGKYVD